MQVDTQVDMQPSNPHLTTERVAAFDHEPFTAEELAHLAGCEACRAERDAVAALVGLAGALGQRESDAQAPRLVEWEQIAAGLRGDTPVVSAPVRAAAPARRHWAPLFRQAAAALLLVAGGAVVGRLTGTMSAARASGASLADASLGAVAESLDAAGVAVRPVAFGNEKDFGSVDEATGVLFRAQRDYERASLWLASNDTTLRDSEVYRTRLAALDQMMEASRAALRDAPQDPVLNHYYLAAYTAREATLQALGGALPVDKIIERY
ncbi:hypothetical protein [Gemmatimonas phototrophica]|uniref:Zinc-finger domain-containing protein n=1 Tax=Gemmatimonas phototrophica TaxID=1379270 RepID=A0A143BMS2_9BACT|nr:hypothetical protein [Gemmatimonas phototrophica]AMW05790.1 hypothetical protein GEMMAAP_15280 [Gemmatimonas phototrophica]